jgi:putative ABC transport system substrate-binding protein
VSDESENVTFRRLIVELAEKGRLPANCPYRQFVEAGGLMSYGIDISDLGQAGIAANVAKALASDLRSGLPVSTWVQSRQSRRTAQ